MPGYVPVYIKFGDQPLEEINPILAEAFGEHGISARNIKTVTATAGDVWLKRLKTFFPQKIESSQEESILDSVLPSEKSFAHAAR